MSLMEQLRPKTKRQAVLVIATAVIFFVSYFVWTNVFVNASIYVAILTPLAILLVGVFDLFFSAILQLLYKEQTT
jgi:uncharacterized protein (DUF983 family)